jgi:predicted site-specific integrase-resolvase
MAEKSGSLEPISNDVFGQSRKPAKMFRAGLYARVSTNDQQTLAMQSRAMREYATRRGWTIALQVREVNSGAAKREAREQLLEAARLPRDRHRASRRLQYRRTDRFALKLTGVGLITKAECWTDHSSVAGSSRQRGKRCQP